ncbi:hypothetical protein R1flu_020676 [Riccia fluitans]|uniref:GATA-type domain-containing protein n=1 Tax=Riccia fluitans TaxID=41844 RepID=A0ABD1ZME3_9MARC
MHERFRQEIGEESCRVLDSLSVPASSFVVWFTGEAGNQRWEQTPRLSQLPPLVKAVHRFLRTLCPAGLQLYMINGVDGAPKRIRWCWSQVENNLSSGSLSSSSLAGTKHLLDGDDAVAGDLCVPCDDLAELEWLSKFVEDSFSLGEVTSAGGLTVSSEHNTPTVSYSKKDRDRFQSASPVSVLESSASSERASHTYRELSSVPGRARSKRARTGGRVWGTTARILSSLSDSGSGSGNDTESLSSDSTAMTGGGNSQTVSVDSELAPTTSSITMNAPKAVCSSVKKAWKGGAGGGGKSGKKGGQDASQAWRCMHCSTTRTPQWRAGPMGPKTLCNACGVRYKSGRLLPEYRPAGSPGYIGHKHSNSHKKILEMRRQREQQQAPSQTSSILSSSSCRVSPDNHLLELEDPDICDSES